MIARFPVGPFESLTQKVWFGVEFVDPVTSETIVSSLVVKLAGSTTKPIKTPSGRFAWEVPSEAFPQTIQFEDAERRYATREYAIDPVLPLPRAPLFRLQLEPTPGYAFGTDVTLVRGRIIATRPPPDSVARGLGDAHVQLQWRNPPSLVPILGPEARVSESGHFACPLPLPPGARPQRKNGDLVVDLIITRRPNGAPAQQTVPQPINGVRPSRVRQITDPFIWDEL